MLTATPAGNGSTAAFRPPSAYADHMPRLREFAALPATDPRRALLREQLIVAYLPVVENLARKHAGRGATREELTQVGAVGLITAIDRWDPDLAHGELLGYLIPCIRGEILRWFRDRSWSVRVPRRLKELSVAVVRIEEPLAQELGRAPRPSELAARLGVDVTDVIDALAARANQTADPLDAGTHGRGAPLVDQLGSADADLEKVEFRHVLRPLLETLPERERTILTLRFFGELTQTQIARRIGISQMHVSRVLARTLRDLRVAMTTDAAP